MTIRALGGAMIVGALVWLTIGVIVFRGCSDAP